MTTRMSKTYWLYEHVLCTCITLFSALFICLMSTALLRREAFKCNVVRGGEQIYFWTWIRSLRIQLQENPLNWKRHKFIFSDLFYTVVVALLKLLSICFKANCVWLFAVLIPSSIRKRYWNLPNFLTLSFLSLFFDNQKSYVVPSGSVSLVCFCTILKASVKVTRC